LAPNFLKETAISAQSKWQKVPTLSGFAAHRFFAQSVGIHPDSKVTFDQVPDSGIPEMSNAGVHPTEPGVSRKDIIL